MSLSQELSSLFIYSSMCASLSWVQGTQYSTRQLKILPSWILLLWVWAVGSEGGRQNKTKENTKVMSVFSILNRLSAMEK